jgi:hypothetical protein
MSVPLITILPDFSMVMDDLPQTISSFSPMFVF